MDIPFDLYKVFYFTVNAGSFSGAAKELYITQSAVSQAIRSLEEKIGIRLFLRKGRGIVLTREGELLFTHIEQAYNFIKLGENKLAEMQDMELGEIRIGVGDTVCRHFIVPCLEKFIQCHPKIKIRVINRTSPQILDILNRGAIDFGIVTLPVGDNSIHVEDFMTVKDIFVASPKLGHLRDRTVACAELARLPLLLLQKGSSTRRNLDSFLKERRIDLVPEVELESVDLLVEFARIGLGISHVLRESALSLMEKGELFEVRLSEELPGRKLGIATVKNMPPSRASAEFIRFLKK